jgi:predicted secreted acid phosphatase
MSFQKQVSIGMDIIDKAIHNKNKCCVIFDIDDTLISSKDHSIIYPIYYLYEYARFHGITTVLITARPGFMNNMKFTMEELEEKNISYDLLYFKPPHMTDIEKYKMFARKEVYDSGYTCIFSIGDMYWDTGDYGGIPILL